jgi:hypothetical protein
MHLPKKMPVFVLFCELLEDIIPFGGWILRLIGQLVLFCYEKNIVS